MADTNTYRIVSANDHLYDTLDIQTQVNELMAKGWEPIGGATKMVYPNGRIWYQTMMKRPMPMHRKSEIMELGGGRTRRRRRGAKRTARRRSN
jgi:hypothetical protein